MTICAGRKQVLKLHNFLIMTESWHISDSSEGAGDAEIDGHQPHWLLYHNND